MAVQFFSNTDKGKVRDNNEDISLLTNLYDDAILAAVIDGVGGNEGGEEAAFLAKITIENYLNTYVNGERLSLLKEAVTEANNAIFDKRKEIPGLSNMCCVLTACLIELTQKRFHLAHVGDTRMYQIANGEFKKITHDHSLVGYREENGNLTEAEAMSHPKRNIISRDVGSQYHKVNDENFIEENSFDLIDNSALLLCSDGLSDMLTSAEIIKVLNENYSIQDRVNGLINAANKKGGADNITVVLIEMDPDYGVIPTMLIAPVEMNSLPTPEVELPGDVAVNETIELLQANPKKTNFPKMLIWVITILISMAIGWFGHLFLGDKIKKYFSPTATKSHTITPQPKIVIDTLIQMQLDAIAITHDKDTFNIDKDTINITKTIIIRNNRTIWIQQKPLYIINLGDINSPGIVIKADSCVLKNIWFINFKDSIHVEGKGNIIK